VATKAVTTARILDGALSAIARQGLRKLSMSDICEEAGIARGTLYRYFKSRDEVLEAVSRHVATSMTIALEQGVRERPDPANRIRVVMDVLIGYWQAHPEMVQVGKVEPAFAMSYLERVLPQFKVILLDFLDPVLAESAAVQSGAATEEQFVDLMLRVAFLHYFMPSPESTSLGEVVANLAGVAAGGQTRSLPGIAS
jgi:AcrR family transcriptional regulator